MRTALHGLAERGQSPWMDQLSRELLRGGELAGLVGSGVLGVTSNPTIFQDAMSSGDAYEAQRRELDLDDPKEIFLALAAQDVRDACDLLAGKGTSPCDGWVSMEVDPRFAYDTEATIDEARRLHEMISRPNLFVKIPGTREGLPAIEDCVARGIPVNVTLLFSLDRHREAAQAYLRGLHRLNARGGDLTEVASVASFFVSRVDTEADARLDARHGHEVLKGTLAIANAKLAYQQYLEIFSGPAWQELAQAGATPQWCLWASTSTKNPAYRDTRYVEELIGQETVTTMPRKTIEAFLDHGRIADTLTQGVAEARRVLERFAEIRLSYRDITDTLERQGVRKFADSYQKLFDSLQPARR
ncbi:transaldolase [Lentzea aerocolonigenes]|uniref:Transaldolase n=1 Tax=Lentzea aerocolonigenes TaxID=68170 RepID=A0A0F0H4W4_LENAE|nr:transaldolase [Lentzea aerocolonigenes]KJK50530.1 transaldolase [Lentzea aerocolonigenes]